MLRTIDPNLEIINKNIKKEKLVCEKLGLTETCLGSLVRTLVSHCPFRIFANSSCCL
jgi:hypothetical protein